MVFIANKKIKCVLFDFWGTVVENGVFPSPVRQVKKIMRVNEPFSDYITKFEESFMTAKFENLSEAFHNVTKEFNLNPPEFVYDKLIGLWNKNTFLSKPFPETVGVLEELKKEYKLVLICNTDNHSTPQVLEKFKLDKYFDAIILSCDVGFLKTNKKMFSLALKKVKVKKEEAVMVGDSIPTDMVGAENAGIKSILVDRRHTREYDNKIETLFKLKEAIEGLNDQS